MLIKIDGNNTEKRQNFIYKGHGMISCNGSSRLLIDYSEKYPDIYRRILDLLFGQNGLGLTHFKVEMGSDVNTSSGTEPTVMRYEDEAADVRRGAGFILAHDIKELYPNVTLDMLWWSEPRWVTDAEDVYAARYRWYKCTLDAAYDTYGLKFDYVSANRNERNVDGKWIVYLSKALKTEKNCPYDYSKIKIVAADECGTWNISGDMLRDSGLMDAVDVIGSHYTSFADDNTKLLAEKYGKEIWFSEGSSPMTYAPSACRADEGRSGLTGINGVLDIAVRMITMVTGGYMTMYEYQPAIASYYDGVTYCQKQLITASTPWNGYYHIDSGFFMDMHFSRFIRKGDSYIYDACRADGKPGGDGHAIVDAKNSFVTACSDDGDVSTVIANTTSEPMVYDFEVTNLAAADMPFCVWETRGPEKGQAYDANYFKNVQTIMPENGCFSVTVKPYSLVTVSTVNIDETTFSSPDESTNTILPLPYTETLDYSDEFINTRGGAPLYTTDEGGAFEIVKREGRNVLMQMITPDIKADEWGGTPMPTTNFGDDRWYNYSISANVLTCGNDSYAGIGARYTLAEELVSGYALHLYGNGEWKLYAGNNAVMNGSISGFDGSIWHSIRLSAVYDSVTAYVDGDTVCEYTSGKSGFCAGRAALYSSYDNCCFDNIIIEAAENVPACVQKLDNLDKAFEYSPDGWEHITMSSFRNYRRTISKGSQGASLQVDFTGTGIILTGEQTEESIVTAELDGNIIHEAFDIGTLSNRRSFLTIYGLENGSHSLIITVKSGVCAVDSAQIL